MKYTTTIQPADRHDEIEIVVEYDYHKGSPGRLSGPPEHCYPAEPAYVEIIAVMHKGVDIEPYLHDDTMIDIEQQIEDIVQSGMEADMEAAAEQRSEWLAEYRRESAEAMREGME